MPQLIDVESLQEPRQTTGPDSVRPSNSLDVRLVVVSVDVMAIPCTIRHRWRDGEVELLEFRSQFASVHAKPMAKKWLDIS